MGVLLLASDLGLHVDYLSRYLPPGLAAGQVTDEEGSGWDFHK